MAETQLRGKHGCRSSWEFRVAAVTQRDEIVLGPLVGDKTHHNQLLKTQGAWGQLKSQTGRGVPGHRCLAGEGPEPATLSLRIGPAAGNVRRRLLGPGRDRL